MTKPTFTTESERHVWQTLTDAMPPDWQVVANVRLMTERRDHEVDLVVLDPPRAGAGRRAVATVAELGPRVVTYVACDPAALARDLGYFREHGYHLEALRGFDAFPMTQHVECIATLRPRS